MATAAGWVIGRFLFPNIAFIVIGIALGVMQWFVLQHRIRAARWWIVATAIGWTLGSMILLVGIRDDMNLISGVIIGITTGTAQWLILRREVYWSVWWIVIGVVAWTTGLALLPGLFLTGVMVGVVTGFALELLLRYPKVANTLEKR